MKARKQLQLARRNPKRSQPSLPTPPPTQPRPSKALTITKLEVPEALPSTNTEHAVTRQGETGEPLSTTKEVPEKGHGDDADSKNIPEEMTSLPASPTKRFLRTSAGVFTGFLNKITGGVLGEYVCYFTVLWCPTSDFIHIRYPCRRLMR